MQHPKKPNFKATAYTFSQIYCNKNDKIRRANKKYIWITIFFCQHHECFAFGSSLWLAVFKSTLPSQIYFGHFNITIRLQYSLFCGGHFIMRSHNNLSIGFAVLQKAKLKWKRVFFIIFHRLVLSHNFLAAFFYPTGMQMLLMEKLKKKWNHMILTNSWLYYFSRRLNESINDRLHNYLIKFIDLL